MADEKPLSDELFHGIIAFITDDSDFTLDAGVVRLSQAFPRRQVSRTHQEIIVAAKNWRLWLHYVDEPFVAEESQEMASWFAGHQVASRIAGCKRRIEFSGTNIEPGSRCFSDFCKACEVLNRFHGTIIFDLEDRDVFC